MESQQHQPQHEGQHGGQPEGQHQGQSEDWLAGATFEFGHAPATEHQLMVAADEFPPMPDGDHDQLA